MASSYIPPEQPSKKLKPELRQRIVQFLRLGNFPATAAKAAGIHRDTLALWRQAGERDDDADQDTEYRRFYLDCLQAEAEAEAHLVALIAKAAPEDWRAAEALLKRRWRQDWGDKTEHSGPDGGPLPLQVFLKKEEQDAI